MNIEREREGEYNNLLFSMLFPIRFVNYCTVWSTSVIASVSIIAEKL